MNQALYYLSYDLMKDKDYQKLYDELAKFKAKRVLLSVWAFKYETGKCSILRDHFGNFIDSDDRLLVTESADWSGRKLIFNSNNL